jgi:sulfate permease, SulP family
VGENLAEGLRLDHVERSIRDRGTDFLRDLVAGLLPPVILVANIISWGALMFPGDFSAGTSLAIWAMLIGSCIGGIWIALATSLPPIATGIDSPTGAVLVLLSSAAAPKVLAATGSTQAAVESVMLIFTAATLVSGVLLFGLGTLRWGSYFRFVPSFVVGGFLGATGWLLIAGGVRMATGATLSVGVQPANWTGNGAAKLVSAMATLAVLLALRRFVKSASAMPVALLLLWLIGVFTLRNIGLADPEHGWYLPSLGELTRWSPISAIGTLHLNWWDAARLLPEMLALAVVVLVSLVTKVSSIEVSRQASGDLDCEFRAHGAASLVAAPFGGIISGLQPGTSRLLIQAGGATRKSGVICSLALGLIGLASFDLPGLIPLPIIAGLVFLLGYTFLVDAFSRLFSQRAWFDLCLATAIMIVCVQYGYLTGVLVGIICACLLFAISYARIGPVRRHATRAQFASNVDRSEAASAYLRRCGDTVQVYWLSGYLFFGSAESVFERIRDDIEAIANVTYVIVDFRMVSGADSSALLSLTKLRHYCDRKGVTLLCCTLSQRTRESLARSGFFGRESRHKAFADIDTGLAWCEEQLLAHSDYAGSVVGLTEFELWLQDRLPSGVNSADLVVYFQRKDIKGTQVLYRSGEPADTIDLVAAGNLAVDIQATEGQSVHLRRIVTHTAVGEMGFFRGAPRSATVTSEGPATVFTLTRSNFERMQNERPVLSNAFYEFIICLLADRVEFSNQSIASLIV